MTDDRKEKVIHTRVPERMEAELKDRAAEIGVSVSNLVRNVLAHALNLTNDVVADSERLVQSAQNSIKAGIRFVRGDGERLAPVVPMRPGHVIGWQPAVLEKNAVCDDCNAIMPRGTDAGIGILEGSGPRPIICKTCLEEVRNGGDK
jgi:hypothetical protein